MVDTNAYIGNWPFRPLPGVTPKELYLRMRAEGIETALVSPIEGIFYDEPQIANESLFEKLAKFLSTQSEVISTLLPVAVFNPKIPNWGKNLIICYEKYKIIAIKLHPNYHQYEIDDIKSQSLLGLSGEINIPVIVQLRVQDIRSQKPLINVPDVDVSKIIELARKMPKTKIIIGGIKWGEAHSFAKDIISLKNLWIDISNIEYINVLRKLINIYGTRQLLFATHAPFFVIKSAILKLKEALLNADEWNAITKDNAYYVFNIQQRQKNK